MPVCPSTRAIALAIVALPLLSPVAIAGQADQKDNTTHGRELSVNGCVTAAPGGAGFVLTTTDPGPLASTLGQVTSDVKQTFTYELIGRVEAVRPFVGKAVVVKGRTDPGLKRDVEIDRERRDAPRNVSGDKAVVKTEEKADIEVRRLHVLSAAAGTGTCTV